MKRFVTYWNQIGIKIKAITEPVTLAEGPHWDSTEQALYFVSTHEGTLHKFVPTTGIHTSSKLVKDGVVSFIIPIEGKRHRFAVGLNKSVVEIEWTGDPDTASVAQTIAEVDQDRPNNVICYGKPDPHGRLFIGSANYGTALSNIEQNQGSLYRIDYDASVHKLEEGVTLTSGLCWDLKCRALYYIDTAERAVRKYDYDEETANPKRIFDYKIMGLQGYPQGMTIDIEGTTWIASSGAHEIIQIDPRTGKLLQKLLFPVSRVTSATFEGPEDILYVTTSKSEGEKTYSGSVFRVTGLRVRGRTNVKVTIR